MTSVESLCQDEHTYVASNFDMSVALICFPCTSRSMGELHASTYSWLYPLRSNDFTGDTSRHVKTTLFGAGTVIVLAYFYVGIKVGRSLVDTWKYPLPMRTGKAFRSHHGDIRVYHCLQEHGVTPNNKSVDRLGLCKYVYPHV
ncbi:hypothetical protein KCU92_g143, partial [Aureobasidium melanogenum]